MHITDTNPINESKNVYPTGGFLYWDTIVTKRKQCPDSLCCLDHVAII